MLTSAIKFAAIAFVASALITAVRCSHSGGIVNVKSGAPGQTHDGRSYESL